MFRYRAQDDWTKGQQDITYHLLLDAMRAVRNWGLPSSATQRSTTEVLRKEARRGQNDVCFIYHRI